MKPACPGADMSSCVSCVLPWAVKEIWDLALFSRGTKKEPFLLFSKEKGDAYLREMYVQSTENNALCTFLLSTFVVEQGADCL